jgi:MFS-type transporter involved in bile tolerance (Atg22 family)
MKIKKNTLIYLFAIEGILYQFVTAIGGLGNTIYATNLGATDTQIGLIQSIPNLIAIILMIPIGLLAEKCKSTKMVPISLLCIMGFSFIGYATVPIFSSHIMVWYFVFLGISLGFMSVYNAQWQIFFGSVVNNRERNRVYAVRNQFMYFVGAIVPLVCGLIMAGLAGASGKVITLRISFYLCAFSLFMQAIIIGLVPGGRKEEGSPNNELQLTVLKNSFLRILKDKKIRAFFATMLFFYVTWQIDWSMWYIGQTQYIGMNESQLGYYNAFASILQMLTIGIFAKLNVKQGVSKTLLIAIATLIIFPIIMVSSMILPLDIRPWVFMFFGVLLCIPLGSVNLCVVQMLLSVLPEEGQSVMLSIYSVMITLSNCIMPLVGVKIYLILGANLTAFFLFFGIEVVIRIFGFFVLRKKITA